MYPRARPHQIGIRASLHRVCAQSEKQLRPSHGAPADSPRFLTSLKRLLVKRVLCGIINMAAKRSKKRLRARDAPITVDEATDGALAPIVKQAPWAAPRAGGLPLVVLILLQLFAPIASSSLTPRNGTSAQHDSATTMLGTNASRTQSESSTWQEHCSIINVAEFGNSSFCPCIPSLEAFGVSRLSTAFVNVTIRGEFYLYGSGYGEQGCAAHDVLKPPDCRVVPPRDPTATVDVSLPGWCFQPWCYVNRSECIGMESSPAAYDYIWRQPENRHDLHFSYATCDTPDIYTKTVASLEAATIDLYLRDADISQREAWWRNNAWAIGVSVGAGLLLLMLLAYWRWQLRRRLRMHFRWMDTLKEPILPPLHSSCHWHLFLSHKWPTGQQQCHAIREKFKSFLPGCFCFLDVYDLKDASKLEQHVAEYARHSSPSLCVSFV